VEIIQDHSGCHHRAGQRATACLIDASLQARRVPVKRGLLRRQ
jgi:hypothetical protein